MRARVAHSKGYQADDLKSIFSKYVVPTLESPKVHLNPEDTSLTTRFPRFNTTGRSCARFGRLAGGRELGVCWAAERSREILENNKATHNEMLTTLRSLEMRQYTQRCKSIKAQKKKLDAYRGRVRRKSPSKGRPHSIPSRRRGWHSWLL